MPSVEKIYIMRLTRLQRVLSYKWGKFFPVTLKKEVFLGVTSKNSIVRRVCGTQFSGVSRNLDIIHAKFLKKEKYAMKRNEGPRKRRRKRRQRFIIIVLLEIIPAGAFIFGMAVRPQLLRLNWLGLRGQIQKHLMELIVSAKCWR